MEESALERTKKRKFFATENLNIVCEHCGRKWTATLAELPVTYFINDLDEYYENISNNVIETVCPPMVLCVFRPTERDVLDTEFTLSCVAPQQESPYHWRITHKYNGPAAASGCQLIPWREQNIITIKEDIKVERKEERIEEIIFDHLIDDEYSKPNARPPCTSSNRTGGSVQVRHNAGQDNSMEQNPQEQDKEKNRDEEILVIDLDVQSPADPASPPSTSSNGRDIQLCKAADVAGRVFGGKKLRPGEVIYVGHTDRAGCSVDKCGLRQAAKIKQDPAKKTPFKKAPAKKAKASNKKAKAPTKVTGTSSQVVEVDIHPKQPGRKKGIKGKKGVLHPKPTIQKRPKKIKCCD